MSTKLAGFLCVAMIFAGAAYGGSRPTHKIKPPPWCYLHTRDVADVTEQPVFPHPPMLDPHCKYLK